MLASSGLEIDRLQLDATMAQKRPGGAGQIDLGDLVLDEGVDLAKLGVGQIRRRLQDVGTGPPAQLELPLFDPVVALRLSDALLGRQDTAPALLQRIQP